MIIMKFGGSSVESAKAIQRVASIVYNHRHLQPAVVVSAMGDTTDQLVAMARFCAAGNQKAAFREYFRFRQFHIREAARLVSSVRMKFLEQQIWKHFDELEQNLAEVTEAGIVSPSASDAILSIGERLSSVIVTEAFRNAGIDAVHLDSRQVIVTDRQHTRALPLLVETNALLRRKVSREQITVMGGFIGATEDGVTTTLGRGGSDYTASIVGAAMAAEEIQIWTDVDGMLTCDPRIVSEAHCLRSISYKEAEEMAKSGAKVLHPATVAPAVRQRIPIVIRNSRNPAARGTRIAAASPCDGAVMSIACRADIALLQIREPLNREPKGRGSKARVTSEFGRVIWELFERAGISFDLIAPSSDKFSLVVDRSSLTADFLQQLRAVAEIEVENDRALITLIGHNAARDLGNLARAVGRLGMLPGDVIQTSCSDSRFAFVIPESSLCDAARVLHREFFQQADPEIFEVSRCLTTAFVGTTAPRRRTQLSTL